MPIDVMVLYGISAGLVKQHRWKEKQSMEETHTTELLREAIENAKANARTMTALSAAAKKKEEIVPYTVMLYAKSPHGEPFADHVRQYYRQNNISPATVISRPPHARSENYSR